jgi:hypothetical protein
MSRATLESLLGNYCEVNKMIASGNNWAVKTANDRKALGSKANLIEEIVLEARRLNAMAPFRGSSRKNKASKQRKTRRN